MTDELKIKEELLIKGDKYTCSFKQIDHLIHSRFINQETNTINLEDWINWIKQKMVKDRSDYHTKIFVQYFKEKQITVDLTPFLSDMKSKTSRDDFDNYIYQLYISWHIHVLIPSQDW